MARRRPASTAGAAVHRHGILLVLLLMVLLGQDLVLPTPGNAVVVADRARVVTAAGVGQWISCSGRGPVTAVVIPGLHATHTMWSVVMPRFVATTRTCVYERPGLGASPGRRPHRTVDAGVHARELWALLAAAGERGPFLLVGHSYGGLVARAFVAQHRRSVAGVLLVEGSSPQDAHTGYWDEGGDAIDLAASASAAAAMRLGSIPLVVESAADPDRNRWGGPSYGETASNLARWRANQARAARLSTDATWVIVRHSAHIIELDRPGAVVAGLRVLLGGIVHRHRLSSCALRTWGAVPLCA